MRRTVSAAMDLEVRSASDLVMAVSATPLPGLSIDETLTVELDGAPLPLQELTEATGTRLHLAHAGTGTVSVRYDATVEGTAVPAPVEELDLIAYRRPSRYCESDQLLPTAQAEFAGLSGKALLDAVSSWVGSQLSYIPGSSKPTDGATETLLARQGVCRDYAHLVVALLRALDVPARLVAVYAPGLDPMDFHAVAEAYVEDAWHVVDATALAPRSTLLRIATGRDAADTAFLTTIGGLVDLTSLTVTAVVDDLPADDVTHLVRLR
ncbi:transglutaminase-like domain-containing protein [Amnibacterium kyonggiense]|uniref:Transglutaminase superfamily protein n=1 Tax=Amnibacterium kyonggiense TaxID=595671 RepID=A0A4R7FGM6_9MICO|nr:transglutaminase family protein [Amnibacterium kyonggiense]TDS75787.1 transglutaminase superfamily protein [Amnibacterium kyonggiense]